MALFKFTFRITIMHIVLVFLFLAVITWYWFSQQIGTIEFQIENLHK